MKKVEDFNASDRIGIKLLDNSIFFLVGEIEETIVTECVKWIVYENLDPKHKVLTLYINSTGGNLYDAFSLIDIMKTSQHPIRTVAIGSVMSAAFLIFAAGTKGERYLGKHTSAMCHQFTSGTEAKYHDIRAEMKEHELLNQKMVDLLQDATGLTPGVIKRKLLPASDVYLTAEETLELGIADNIL